MAEAPPERDTPVPFEGAAPRGGGDTGGGPEAGAGRTGTPPAETPVVADGVPASPGAAPSVQLLSLEEARRKIDPEALAALETQFNGRLARVRQLDEGDQLK